MINTCYSTSESSIYKLSKNDRSEAERPVPDPLVACFDVEVDCGGRIDGGTTGVDPLGGVGTIPDATWMLLLSPKRSTPLLDPLEGAPEGGGGLRNGNPV